MPKFIQGPNGPLNYVNAKFERASDGDTIDAKVEGELSVSRIRLCGVNTFELTDYGTVPAGDGVEAALFTRKVLSARPTIRLSSRFPDSVTGDRLKRYVSYQRQDGTWADLGADLIANGHARTLAQNVEYDRNLQYAQLARKAAIETVKSPTSIWNPTQKGVGPVANLKLLVDFSGEESVTISNVGNNTVDLSDGWWLCDGMTRGEHGRGFQFPVGAKVLPGKSVFVYIGSGTNTSTKFYWDIGSPYMFDNPTGAPMWMNDGAYLGDKLGNIRAWYMYPDLSRAPIE